MNTSLDGCIEDRQGRVTWGAPSEEVHRFINDLQRRIGTYLYGRRLYQTMICWDTPAAVDNQPSYVRDFATIWRTADKVVYSTTLSATSTDRTRLERQFDAKAVRAMKAAEERDMTIGGAQLAGRAMTSGLVDEVHLLIHPIILGGGKRALPEDAELQMALLDEHRFGDGVVCLQYRVASAR